MSDLISVGELLTKAENYLTDHNVTDARLDARLLLEHILGVSHASLISMHRDHVEINAQNRFQELLVRRARGEPVHRIIGSREFFGREFELSQDTLIPRPETEILVEAALLQRSAYDAPIRILELGVGSGAISVSLASEMPNCQIMATDISSDALEIARRNAVRWSVEAQIEFVLSDMFDCVSGRFDLIVSNPPYIPSKDIGRLSIEVREHDPLRALDGGESGLDFYHQIFENSGRYLNNNGMIMLEFGLGQADEISAIARGNSFENISIIKDLSGVRRVITVS